MNRKFSPRKIPALCLGAAAIFLLALMVWRFSPGPEWMATRTAEGYLEQYAPEFSQVTCGQGKAERYFYPLGFRVTVGWPTWYMTGEPEGGRDGAFVRLELNEGIFPTKVTEAFLITHDENGIQGREELPLPA